MEYFRFTLFNSITLFVLVLTVLTALRRFSYGYRANWPLVYWAIVLGYTFGFQRSLDPAWTAAGAICAIALRFGRFRVLRWAELAAFAYVAWRSIGLILLW